MFKTALPPVSTDDSWLLSVSLKISAPESDAPVFVILALTTWTPSLFLNFILFIVYFRLHQVLVAAWGVFVVVLGLCSCGSRA